MLKEVNFRGEDYGEEIARILAPAGGGNRPMPLLKPPSAPAVKPLEFLPGAVRSGLYLYFGCWDAAHTAADSVEDPNGYFWHAIVHRQEPDGDNAGYWFRKTGKHPIFPRIAGEAREIGYRPGREWDPFAFVEFCESASRQPGSREEQLAIQVQLVEWQLLFDYCARGQNC
jgi:hypothetical protein